MGHCVSVPAVDAGVIRRNASRANEAGHREHPVARFADRIAGSEPRRRTLIRPERGRDGTGIR